MQDKHEKLAFGSIIGVLALAAICGSVVDLRLAAKAEHNTNPAQILASGYEECSPPSPAMVADYAGCTDKSVKTHNYYTARLTSLASSQ